MNAISQKYYLQLDFGVFKTQNLLNADFILCRGRGIAYQKTHGRGKNEKNRNGQPISNKGGRICFNIQRGKIQASCKKALHDIHYHLVRSPVHPDIKRLNTNFNIQTLVFIL